MKIRDRASFAFAHASWAAALELDGKTIEQARLALGGVGTKPWRAAEAEQAVVGKPAAPDTFRGAAEAALRDAKPRKESSFKLELAKRTGMGAAIANAVYHATGKRVRDLPITLDELL